jgi:hemolysin activation/secretion protein
LGRQQQLAPLWVLDVNLSGQHAFDNLDSSERFSLGGASGVRAYPTGEGGGDEGSLLSLNLTKQLSDTLYGTLFVDSGYVRNNHETWAGWNAADPGQKNSYVLSGFGAAINWSFQNEVSVSATLAAPIGNNPGRDANDNDSDGRSQNVRGWISLVAQF